MPVQVVECVPNFSEGQDAAKIKQIIDAIEAVASVRLLDVDPGRDTNRTVVTFVGPPHAVAEAAFRAIGKAAEVIDMSRHDGEHPRLGATDVCPFVPVEGITLAECAVIARQVGKRVGDELGIPVYFYEAASLRPERTNLATIREGEYEGLAAKLRDPQWKPDCGPAEFNPRTGATVIGAREFLIAYNITLNTRDKAAASDIALELREAGRVARTKTGSPYYSRGDILYYGQRHFPCGNCDFVGTTFEETERHCRDKHGYQLRQLFKGDIDLSKPVGEKVRRAGTFRFCKAIGWYVEQYRRSQVSINLTNYHITPPYAVLEEARRLATERGLVVTGSEVVGMIPYRAMLEAGRYYLNKQGASAGAPAADLLETAVFSMGLNDVQPFDVEKKVIGSPARKEDALVNLDVANFIDEVSRDTPAPGGGSIAALAGSLGAALASMVANLTHKKSKDPDSLVRLAAAAEKAQTIKDKLLALVDEDTKAFNAYLEALRLPSDTPERQRVRSEQMQAGLTIAVNVPYHTAMLSFEAMQLSRDMARDGLAASLTDAAVGCEIAFAGVRGGVWNVLTNLAQIADRPFVDEKRQQCSQLLSNARSLLREVTDSVDQTLGEKLER